MRAKGLGRVGFVGAEADADEGAEFGLMLARHAQLEVVGAALEGDVGHEKSSGTLKNNAAELMGSSSLYSKMYSSLPNKLWIIRFSSAKSTTYI